MHLRTFNVEKPHKCWTKQLPYCHYQLNHLHGMTGRHGSAYVDESRRANSLTDVVPDVRVHEEEPSYAADDRGVELCVEKVDRARTEAAAPSIGLGHNP